MSVAISRPLIQTISGDKRCAISCGVLVRKHNITSWNSLRVGMRCCMERGYGGTMGNSNFGIALFTGFCYLQDNQTGSVGMPYTKNAMAIFTGPQNWSYTGATGANMSNWNGTTNNVLWTEINNVGAFTLPFGTAAAYFPAEPTASIHRMYFADFFKSGNTITSKLFGCTSQTSAPDVSENDFRTQMTASSPSFTNHAYSAASNSIPFTETSGSQNAAFIYWQAPNPRLFVSDWAVVKLS